MSTDLTTAGDGFGVMENNREQLIVGKMIKYADGDYIVDKTETLPDTALVVIGVVTAWVHWVDGSPIEHRVTYEGDQHPDNDEMPDRDESKWPLGLNGEPADPWRDTRYLRLIHPQTGHDFTFVTDSFGGRRAIGMLKSQIQNVRMAYPAAVPLVEPASVPWKTKYGLKKRPDFTVVGWRNRNGSPAPTKAPPLQHLREDNTDTPAGEPEPPPHDELPARRDDMDDFIAF